MKRGVTALGVVSLLAGCQQQEAQIVEYNGWSDLACAKGFETLVNEIASTPGIVTSIHERGSDTYRDDRNYSLFLVTKPDHPAHPAIFLRFIVPTSEGNVINTRACGYGDLEAMRREVATQAAFDRLLQAEEVCYLCDTEKVSPSVDRRIPPPTASMIQTQ